MALYHWIYHKIESYSLLLRWEAKNRPMIVWGILLLLILTIVPPKTLKPQRYERLSEKWAGQWIKNQSGRGMTIFTTLSRVAYYADGSYEYVNLRKNTVDKIKASMIEKKALYLVIREKDISDYAKEVKSIQKDFAEIIRFEQEGMEKIIIYEIIH